MPSKAIPTVSIVLRKDSRFKTWLQRIKGANTAGIQVKGKTYDLIVEFLKADGETASQRAFKVGSGWYMMCQPMADGSGRDIRRFNIDSTGSVRWVTETELRAAFGLGAKTTSKAAKPTYAIPTNAIVVE